MTSSQFKQSNANIVVDGNESNNNWWRNGLSFPYPNPGSRIDGQTWASGLPSVWLVKKHMTEAAGWIINALDPIFLLQDICVGPEFKQIHTEILKKRKLNILHGPAMRQVRPNIAGVRSTESQSTNFLFFFCQDDIGKVVDWSTVVDSEQPIFVLFDCMRRANLRVTDIFHAFDKDKSNTLTREELKHGLLVGSTAVN